MIPRIFHQIWLGPDPFPDRHSRCQESWLRHHPGWELRFWTEESLPELVRRPEALESLRSPAERADLLRLELVWHFGGVYVDTDFECLRSIEQLIADAELFVARDRMGRLTNALFGAAAAHPVLDRALETVRPREFPGYDEGATGARFFDRVLSEAGEAVTIADPAAFYPRTSAELEGAYAVSRALRRWRSLEEARKAHVKAERRQQDAQTEIRYWRDKYEEATKPEERVSGPDRQAATAPPRLKIPPIIHQIWLGPDPLPADFVRYQQTWLDRHPGWELRFWTEDNLPTPLRRPEATERLRVAAERSDILRLEVLWRFGGVYVDSDFECRRSIEPLIEDAELFVGLAGPDRVRNGLFGAVAGHPLLDRALDELRPRVAYGYEMESGPKFLDEMVAGRDDVLFLPPETFYPTTAETTKTAYAVHRAARSWKAAELLWADVWRAQSRMEEKLEAAEVQANAWRERFVEAESEVERLRRSWPRRLSRLGRSLSRRARA